MEQESVPDSVLIDVFAHLKSEQSRAYLILADFETACKKYKPKCLIDYYGDSESLQSCCVDMFNNMCESAQAVQDESVPDEGGIIFKPIETITLKKTIKKPPPSYLKQTTLSKQRSVTPTNSRKTTPMPKSPMAKSPVPKSPINRKTNIVGTTKILEPSKMNFKQFLFSYYNYQVMSELSTLVMNTMGHFPRMIKANSES